MNQDLLLIGIDGGGSGTRVVLGDAQGRELAQAASGPSGLGLGVERAWQAIAAGCAEAFARAGVALDWSRCVLGCGLAGVNNREWLAAFRAQAPAVAGLAVESDAYTTLLGAHGGAPGVVVALGTGSVAAVLDAGGECRIAGGFGYPSGDEASGAWLGLRAIVHAQQSLDGRVPHDDFAQALLAHTGAHDRDSLVVWLCDANQTAYAKLAPIVIAHRSHVFAARLLGEAGIDVGKMIAALDPSASLPVAMCGGLGAPLREYVPQVYQARLREPLADSARGGLQLARRVAEGLAGND
ncbi:ATPase [Paraburkholderia sp. D15]|uniref:BadF/BadG/BcrA/BcrD ATPase family protein n=1 Tax=Paraburkholderia sp. D15 TaxID=2880218 RepID=UPI002478DEB2|nr:BadF/BadG/BcrA/BcrD ATPase family protein [Paraburkholderia sp. D15]WGS49803.1 ATPase [Paraburkholderia sp. D15]